MAKFGIIEKEFDVEASEPLLPKQVDEQGQDEAEEAEADSKFWQTVLPIFFGWNSGLLMQYIAVRARTHQIVQWHDPLSVPTFQGADLAQVVEYHAYTALSHIDVFVCLVLWVFFVTCLRHRMDSGFHMGMCLLIGIICGSSAAWMSLDYLLGFPVPLSIMFLTLSANLSACVLALRCRAVEVEELKEAEEN